MKLQILNWSYTGIRGINDLNISLEREPGEPHWISLIQMRNGTGKTTTIDLMRAIFDGNASNWNVSDVLNFKPPGSSYKQGSFNIKFTIDSILYVIGIKLDYEKGKAHYWTSSVSSGGQTIGHKLPPWVKDIFTQEFVKRFVFDGELSQSILEAKSNEAEHSLQYLYNLNKLDELSSSIDSIVALEQQNAENSRAKSEKFVTRYRNELIKYEMLLKQLETKRDENLSELQKKNSRLIQVIAQISERVKADDNLRKEAEELEQKLNIVRDGIKEKTQSILSDMRNPYALSPLVEQSLSNLLNKLKFLGLPKTMSRHFFYDLAEQSYCICGRDIGPSEKINILDGAKNYLADDDISVINAIKSGIKDRCYTNTLEVEINELNAFLVDKIKCDNKWDSLQTRRKASGDFELEKLEEEEITLKQDIENLNTLLQILTTVDKVYLKNLAPEQNIFLCEEKKQEASKKLAEVTNTLSLLKRSKIAKEHLGKIKKIATKNIKNSIIDIMNSKISKIITNETIKVIDIKNCLVLEDKAGASVGQSLAIAYSFLGSMFERSSFELPFIVDSPAGSLDLEVRREVAKAIPRLFNQLIIFIISSEREGFANKLYTLGSNVQFLTIEKNIHGQSICNTDIDFFKNFQSDIDDETE